MTTTRKRQASGERLIQLFLNTAEEDFVPPISTARMLMFGKLAAPVDLELNESSLPFPMAGAQLSAALLHAHIDAGTTPPLLRAEPQQRGLAQRE